LFKPFPWAPVDTVAAGITDPFKFTEKHKDYKYSHELIQDDETFDASLVNIGLIGVEGLSCI
jgi:hypothetical protein